MSSIHMNNNTLKYISLITLTLQNAILGLSMRYSRTRPGEIFISSTAVLMSEIVKLITCLFLVFNEEGKKSEKFIGALHKTIIANPMDTLKVCVPSLVYIVQNNLLYVSATHLDAATYQVTYQLKILTTAMFAVIILRRQLQKTQWGALVLLVLGIVLVQLANTDTESSKASYTGPEQNRMLGLWAALGACFLSGFAGIYFEKILKGAEISVWMRNVQLSLLSIPFGVITCFASDSTTIFKNGFFFGYDLFIWYLVFLQAGGGLIVAVVVKYADNILKGFATSLAIIISCVASIYIFSFNLTLQFTFGASFVIASIFLYGYVPNKKTVPVKVTPTREEEEEEENLLPNV